MTKRKKMVMKLSKAEAAALSIELCLIRAAEKRKKVEELVASYYEPATLAELRQFRFLVNKILVLIDNPDVDLDAEPD